MSKVLDDAKATADAANALVSEIETTESEGTVTPVDKVIDNVVINYTDGTSDTIVKPGDSTLTPTVTDTVSDTASDSGSSDSSNTPADSDSGEPTPEPQPVAAGTIPE